MIQQLCCIWRKTLIPERALPSLGALERASFTCVSRFPKHASFGVQSNSVRNNSTKALNPDFVNSSKRFSIRAMSSTSSNPNAHTHSETINIELIPCLKDNYAYALVDESRKVCAVVDPSESDPVAKFVSDRGLKLALILNTHHHYDHTGGNLQLKKLYGAQIIGPKADMDRIPGIDLALGENDTWEFFGHEMKVLDTPGHTRGHVTYYFQSLNAVFTGDTLFSLGCGRLFEGTPKQMWQSLNKITSLPPQTNIYCGHEYTQSNARFAVTIEPNNPDLLNKIRVINDLRTKNLPTIPVVLSEELKTNPFLRPFSKEIAQSLKLSGNSDLVDVFAAIRRAKDSF